MNDYVERRANPPVEDGWHLKKEVNLSIIISIITVGIACVGGYYDLKKEIALIKQEQTALAQRDSKIEADTRYAIKQLNDALIRVETKLDRLIERVAK
jgi:hypothetical protein